MYFGFLTFKPIKAHQQQDYDGLKLYTKQCDTESALRF